MSLLVLRSTDQLINGLTLKCPGGEIGRRTVFRSQRSQGCAGSNPVLGTEVDKSKIDSVCPFSFWLKPLSRLYISETASFILVVRY